MIIMRPLPDLGLQELLTVMLSPGVLHPVDTARLGMLDLHNAYRNADEHLLVVDAIDMAKADEETREAAKRLRTVCAKVRRDAYKLMLVQRMPLANAMVERYRMAIAINYEAMMTAGAVLVSLSEPLRAELYRSLCTP